MTQRNSAFLVVGMLVALMLASSPLTAQGISVDLGKTTQGRYMKLVGNTGDGAIQDVIKLPPEYCAKNLGTAMYFDIADDFFSNLSGTYVILNVEYYDTLAVDIQLFYDDIASHGKQHAMKITTAGTNKWKSFSFLLDDAYFGNGLTNGADFKLTCTGTMFINAVKVVPFDKYINYGDGPCAGGVNDSDDVFGITHNEYQGGDSRTVYSLVDGEWCITTNKPNSSGYLYCGVDDAYIYGGNHPYVFVSVEYYDPDPTQYFRLQYDAPGNNYKNSESVYGKNWGSFRTYTFEVPDALFNNLENGGSDFRLYLRRPGIMINRITVAILPKKPLPNTSGIANQTAFKLLEPPAIDGALSDWDWLNPGKTEPRFNTDLSRSDEYYRTWLLNSANAPIVEAGEPNVVDPAVPGMWDQNDLTCWYRTGWDDTNLYFAVVVKDNVTDVAGASWNEKDGFGFYFDVSHAYVLQSGVQVPIPIKDDPNFQTGEHFIFLPASSSDLGWWKHGSSQTGEALPTSVVKAVVPTDSGYIMEVAIPLSLLRDGLTWNPGVLGDQDNFNPLFAFMVNDADNVGASSGRLMYGGHSDDDEFWGTMNLAPLPMVDKGFVIDLGTTNYENLITQVEKAGDGAVTPVQKQGKNCVKATGGYVYLDVSDAVVMDGNHKHLLVSVEYLDTLAGNQFRLQYDALSAPYKDTPWITLGNTNTWKTAIFEIDDAKFSSSQNSRADFRLHSPTMDLCVNQVRVVLADLWRDVGDSTNFGIVETNLGGDGVRLPAFVGGNACLVNAPTGGYFYFTVADSIIFNGNHRELFLGIEYYDTTSANSVGLNYESMTTTWGDGIGNAFILGTNQWKLHTFYLPDAKFANGESGGSDFRVNAQGSPALFVHRIFIGSMDALTDVEEIDAVPAEFALAQNYPNPFNPATTIKYSLPTEGLVTLKIYNMLGQEVSTLVHATQNAGTYSVRWDAAKQPTGVYIYRLTQGEKVMTQKLLLLK